MTGPGAPPWSGPLSALSPARTAEVRPASVEATMRAADVRRIEAVVADGDEIAIERGGERIEPVPASPEHPQDIDGVAGVGFGRNRRLAGTEAEQGSGQYRRGRNQAERVFRRIAVRQEGDAGADSVVQVEVLQRRQERSDAVEYIAAGRAKCRGQAVALRQPREETLAKQLDRPLIGDLPRERRQGIAADHQGAGVAVDIRQDRFRRNHVLKSARHDLKLLDRST